MALKTSRMTPTQRTADRLTIQAAEATKIARERTRIARRLQKLAAVSESVGWTDAQEDEWDRLIALDAELTVVLLGMR